MAQDHLTLGNHTFQSRLFVGTGKYKDVDETARAIEASGAQVVTVALRRVSLNERGAGSMMGMLTSGKYTLLPNTAGCFTADEAVRTCRLARELGLSDLVKLEVIGDPKTLFPDNESTLEAARILVKEGFTVLPYCIDNPVVCRKLEDVGCAAVMPLAAPIGSGLGIRNPYNLMIIREQAKVPLIVDAGVGTASDAAYAMELGCDGVLMNTAIAAARDPIHGRSDARCRQGGSCIVLSRKDSAEALRVGFIARGWPPRAPILSEGVYQASRAPRWR